MDKEDVVHIYDSIPLSHKKMKGIVPFAATWMDLGILTLDEVSQTDMWYCLYVEYKKSLQVKSSLGWEDPLEEEMAIHSSILAWRTPWTEESGGLQSIELQRIEHDWSDLACKQELIYKTQTEYRCRK